MNHDTLLSTLKHEDRFTWRFVIYLRCCPDVYSLTPSQRTSILHVQAHAVRDQPTCYSTLQALGLKTYNAPADTVILSRSAGREAASIPPGADILEYVYSLNEAEQTVAMEKIKAIESEAMPKQKAQPGLVELMDYLESNGIPKAICTRNFE